MKFKNSKYQGNWGLGQAIAYFTKIGWPVCVPLTDSQPYDLIVEFPDGLKKIEVKSSVRKTTNGVYLVEIRTRGGNYNSGMKTIRTVSERTCDYMFVVTLDCCYLIPADKVSARIDDKFSEFKC